MIDDTLLSFGYQGTSNEVKAKLIKDLRSTYFVSELVDDEFGYQYLEIKLEPYPTTRKGWSFWGPVWEERIIFKLIFQEIGPEKETLVVVQTKVLHRQGDGYKWLPKKDDPYNKEEHDNLLMRIENIVRDS